MLIALFQLNSNDFGIDTTSVHKIIPALPLKPVPKGNETDGVTGTLEYEGTTIPIIDLGKLIYNKPVRNKLSSRIFIIHDEGHYIGLLGENAIDTIHIDPSKIKPLQINYKNYSYLNSNFTQETGVSIQIINLKKLIQSVSKNIFFISC